MQNLQSQDGFRAGLRFYRKNLGVSQDELAALAGVSRATIGNFETSQFNLSANSMERVRKALLELLKDRATALGFSPAALPPANLSLSSDMRAA